MTAHTPGPWNTSRDAVPQGHTQITIYTESGLGERVATAFISEANANLIAAAPEMLAALGNLVYLQPMSESNEATRLAYSIARAAIAKAEGTL